MEKKYMVVGYGYAKDTGNPYSRACLLKEGRDKKYGFLDQKDTYYTNDIREVGTIITVTLLEG